MVGRTLDRYRLLEQVGQGGMAVVYRALDVPLNREVAVKVLHAHLSSQPESRARLQREAQAVAQLRHDNIPEIFAYSGLDSADSYLVTEFIHGPTLKAFITEHPLPFPEIGVMTASEIARALSCAHEVGIIHRDVKPENVMIRADGTVVLCDFGIAQVVDKDRMTATGQLLGSPAYMAPEHIEGKPLDCRTDVFSLGVLLYQLTCGELPFHGKNPHETLHKITDGHFTPPEELSPLCSTRLSRIISKALSREPDERFAQVSQMRDELLGLLADAGIEEPRRELRDYFHDPEAYGKALAPRLVQALICTGSRMRSEGRTAAALSNWGRALQIEPDNAQISTLIKGLARREQGLRVARMSALALLLGGAAVWGGPHLFRQEVRIEKMPQIAVAWDLGGNDAAVDGDGAEAGVDLLLPSPVVVRVPHRVVQRVPEAPRRTVRLEPWPKAVRVSLNGKVLGDYGSDVRTVELPPGPNELGFDNPACYTERVPIAADSDPGEIRVRLRWKPALLLVRSADADADVVVDGKMVGRTGQVMALPVQGDDGRATVDVQVSAPGRGTESRSVQVRANQLTSLDITLPLR